MDLVKKSTQKIRLVKTHIFMFAYSLMLASNMFSYILKDLSFVLDTFNYIGAFLCVVVIIANIRSYRIWHWIFFALFSIIFILSDGSLYRIKFVLLILASINLSVDTIIKKDLIVRSAYMVVILTLFFIGVGEDVLVERSQDSVRHSLGFIHPNMLSFHMSIIILDIIYVFYKIKNRKIPVRLWLIIIAMMLSMTFVANSRTPFLICCGVIIAVNIKPILNSKVMMIIGTILFGFLFLLSFNIIKQYTINPNDDTINQINEITSGRVRLISLYYTTFGIHIIGNSVDNSSLGETIAFDNGYMYDAMSLGILYIIIMAIMYTKTMSVLYKEKNYILIWINIALCVYMLFEAYIGDAAMNIYLVTYGLALHGKQTKNNSELGLCKRNKLPQL